MQVVISSNKAHRVAVYSHEIAIASMHSVPHSPATSPLGYLALIVRYELRWTASIRMAGQDVAPHKRFANVDDLMADLHADD